MRKQSERASAYLAPLVAEEGAVGLLQARDEGADLGIDGEIDEGKTELSMTISMCPYCRPAMKAL